MKRVLVISYFYPPYSSVGATRVSKMTRYLEDSGWESHVLTVDRCDLPATLPVEIPEARIVRVRQAFDVTSLPRALAGGRRASADRVNPSTTWRARMMWRCGEIYRHIACFPDAQVGWRTTAIAAGSELVQRMQPDVILSSSLPNTSHLVAREIARRTGLPWVAELRDLWTANHNFRRIQPLRAVEQRLERSVLSKATALVTVSDVLADWLRREYNLPTFVVRNGYDPNDYPPAAPPDPNVFTLVYTGMFYQGKQDVAPLFDAVARLQRAGRINPEKFRLHFVGQRLAPVLAAAQQRGISSVVQVSPPVSYREALRLQREATALLVLDFANAARTGYFSVKVFEYLGAARPILNLGHRAGTIGEMLASTAAGTTAETSEEVERVLSDWLSTFERTRTLPYIVDASVRAQYERQAAAREMAGVLEFASSSPAVAV